MCGIHLLLLIGMVMARSRGGKGRAGGHAGGNSKGKNGGKATAVIVTSGLVWPIGGGGTKIDAS